MLEDENELISLKVLIRSQIYQIEKLNEINTKINRLKDELSGKNNNDQKI
ncbi:MAG: hypothetical protein ACTSPW_13150 [Promethearchaeota archaeon]